MDPYLVHFVWNCHQAIVTRPHWWLINIFSVCGFVPSGNKQCWQVLDGLGAAEYWHCLQSLDIVLDETRYEEKPRPGSNQIIQGKSRWNSTHWMQSDNQRPRNYGNWADCGKQSIRSRWPNVDSWRAGVFNKQNGRRSGAFRQQTMVQTDVDYVTHHN